tara:strand:- start:569 stop:1582 length:1014 start_codon:yes stop_codon:yes gene_type:complete
MEKVEFKIPYTKFGTIYADKDGDSINITGVSKDDDKQNVWALVYKGHNLWKYNYNFAVYQQGKNFIGYGRNNDNDLVEVNFSKRPNRHVLGSEKPEGSYWSAHNIATYDEHHILLKAARVIKRTQEEARIKAEKLLRQRANENRARCGACERWIERWDEGNWNGVIYDHGFEQAGYRAGVCVGARYQPWEKSPDGKIAFIKQLQVREVEIVRSKPDQAKLNKLIKLSEEYVAWNDELTKLKQNLWQDFRHSPWYPYKNLNVNFRNYLVEQGYKKFEQPKRNPQFFGVHVWKNTTLDELLDVWQRHLEIVRDIISKEKNKVDNWKEQLTPRERVNASN